MAGGVEIKANAVNATRGLLVVWLFIPVVGIFAAWAAASLIPLAISPVLFGALGLIAWPRLQMQWLWGRPSLKLAATTVGLGERVEFVYERTSRRALDVSSAKLMTELICQERVEWESGHGDNRSTESEEQIVARVLATHTVEPMPTGLRVVSSFDVPANAGAPTIRFDHHRISWQLQAKLDGERLPPGSETFELIVAPSYVTTPAPIDTILDQAIQDSPAQDQSHEQHGDL